LKVNWDQLKTILWLRWRLTRNQWARSGGLGAIIAAIVAAAMFVLGGASFIAALLGGILGLGEAKPPVVMGVWFGLTAAFLFLWLIGLINEIQRSESIDLQRLMHLPVALGQMFIVNYLASHLALSVVLVVPAMMGLAIGLVVSRGPTMLLLIPLALGMVFMVTAWTYCLRGWLATLMSNPRRRRTVIMVITVGFILLAQAPNLYLNVIRRFDRPAPGTPPAEAQRQREAQKTTNQEKFDRLLAAQKFIPPLWLPVGAQALAEGRVLPALLGTLGCFALGALGLRRAYQSTLRFYHGESGGKAAAQIKPNRLPATATTPAKAGSRFLELRLPAVPEQAAALALATFRSMLRAPEVKIAWGTSFLVTLIVGGSFLFRSAPKMPEAAKPFIATGVVAFSIFMMVQFLANQFGFDRDGFRALILSPADRRLILIGKNLACLPASAGLGVMLLALIAVWLRLPPFVLLAALFQLVALLLLAGLVGNVLSILVPYRIQPGSMKPTKMPGLAMLVMMACHMCFPIAMAPAFVPPLAEFLWQRAGWPGGVPVNLLLSAALAMLTGFAYWQTLGPLGRLLQRRETKILGVVTVEVE
jgi:ABC-2 type transport system permease protein